MVLDASEDDSGLEGTSFFISLVVLSRVWGHVYVCARVPAVGGMCGLVLFQIVNKLHICYYWLVSLDDCF